MKLSEYCDKKEALWNEKEEEKVEKLIKYINDNINDDLFKIANTNDSIDKFIKWICKKFDMGVENNLIRDFERENNILLDAEKQIKHEEREKDLEMEM